MNFSPLIMSDAIKKIRELLDELEARNLEQPESFRESFQLFELPQLVGDIVDYLQPALLPYEAAIYWHLFRHSIIATGDVFARASVRGLARRSPFARSVAALPSSAGKTSRCR